MSIEADIVELLQALDNYIPGENDDCVADRIKESASAIRKLRAERDAAARDMRERCAKAFEGSVHTVWDSGEISDFIRGLSLLATELSSPGDQK